LRKRFPNPSKTNEKRQIRDNCPKDAKSAGKDAAEKAVDNEAEDAGEA